MHKKIQIVIFKATPYTSENRPENDEYQVLLLQTNSKRGSFWQNVTGTVEEGESFVSAAQRELFEETTYENKVYDLHEEDHFIDRKNCPTVERIFYTLVDSQTDPLLSNEHQSFIWKRAKTLKENDYQHLSNFKAFQLAYKALLKKGP